MISAAQCRSARTLLGWSVNKLSSAASVPESVIDDFELERRRPSAATLDAIRRAFTGLGFIFLRDGDIRVRTEARALG
jgi:transcriptional regulator with XRE-family HTH domain